MLGKLGSQTIGKNKMANNLSQMKKYGYQNGSPAIGEEDDDIDQNKQYERYSMGHNQGVKRNQGLLIKGHQNSS